MITRYDGYVALSYSPTLLYGISYSLIGFSLTPVEMIILPILRTYDIAFIVSRTLTTLLSFY